MDQVSVFLNACSVYVCLCANTVPALRVFKPGLPSLLHKLDANNQLHTGAHAAPNRGRHFLSIAGNAHGAAGVMHATIAAGYVYI